MKRSILVYTRHHEPVGSGDIPGRGYRSTTRGEVLSRALKGGSMTFLLLLLFISKLSAQVVEDALRYSQVFYQGSARFMSMGGAFTALGGDVSSFAQNPAGLGVFRSSEISITPRLFHFKSDAGFMNFSTSDYFYDFNLSQAGLVVNLMKKSSGSGLSGLNLGYAYNRTNNFKQSMIIEGTGTNSSLLDYWADISHGYTTPELMDNVPEAFLGYDTWLIDTLSGSFDSYGTVYSNYGDDPPSVYGQNINRVISNEGYTAEHDFSIGGNYSDKLFFGMTFSITSLSYSSLVEHSESTDENLISEFTDFHYSFRYTNKGRGYGIKLGAIFKPVEPLRLGFAFHSPTLFKIDEYVDDNITSYFSNSSVPFESANEKLRYNYALTTPFRALAGAAFQYKKIALFSLDYEFVDYSTARFSETGDDYSYSSKNKEIKNGLRAVNNLRFGVEARMKNIYLRGGYGIQGRAWRENDINENLRYNTVSLGAGFREQNIYLDFGYTTTANSQKYILYEYGSERSMSDIQITRDMFVLTLGFKFGN